jgi:hypothetical protein
MHTSAVIELYRLKLAHVQRPLIRQPSPSRIDVDASFLHEQGFNA